ncbi:PREDICTED: protein PET117 homolog, mitochondrial [Tinamus guttatus]|uniref:protein PET117 homolog, mitochondrial n=1 Tax=Tinamus guttatus TaxID=94827 RepID=UPI00052EF23C|nr:PREDICTED: protein PET117 homolog, mitochondrial [Tinamus guttatus]
MAKGSRELKICKGNTINSAAGGIRAQRLHKGVLRDLERLSQKEENIRRLEEQISLTKQLKEDRDKMLLEKGSQHS